MFGLPGTDQIAIGETLEYTLQVQNVTNLYAFDVKVSFDTTYLEIVDSDPSTSGTQVANGGFLKVGAVVKNEVQNGTIWFVMTQLNPEPAKSGSGALIRFKLRGKQKTSSSTPLTAPSVQLSNSSSTSVPVTITNSSLTVIEKADVGIEITNGPASITANSPFSYTALVSNDGPSPIQSLHVESSFSTAVTNLMWTCHRDFRVILHRQRNRHDQRFNISDQRRKHDLYLARHAFVHCQQSAFCQHYRHSPIRGN